MNTIYVQGFSTSMPHDIQEKMVHSLPGLENCTILKYAYAIEYDAIDPLQLWPSLETKVLKNLFTAGRSTVLQVMKKQQVRDLLLVLMRLRR